MMLPDAFARVVDRLLASPHYGEEWGRHWLDLVRYADTAGENTDHPLPHAWRYRNWVIAAFNRDMPFDAFVREQVAGDILASEGPPDRHTRTGWSPPGFWRSPAASATTSIKICILLMKM